LLGDDAVENERERWRHDDADRARGADHPEREGPRIAARQHRRQQNGAHGERGRDTGATDRGKQGASDHGDEAERAAHAAEPGGGEIDQRLRHPTAPHESRRHDKKRQRHQRRRVELIDDDLSDADQRLSRRPVERRSGDAEHEEDRHAEREQAEKQR